MIEVILHIISFFISSIDLIDGIVGFFTYIEPMLSSFAILLPAIYLIYTSLFKLNQSAEPVTMELANVSQKVDKKK